MNADDIAERLYAAFARLDGEAMAACYAADARFSDPVFPDLRGAEVGAMWRMLCAGARDWKLEYRVLPGDETHARAAWAAHYRFSATGRVVLNSVRTHLRVADGLIVEQRDAFGFWRWSRQALGTPGWLLGWTPLVRATVRAQAAARLAEFRRSESALNR